VFWFSRLFCKPGISRSHLYEIKEAYEMWWVDHQDAPFAHGYDANHLALLSHTGERESVLAG
jgi:hypothetical protein